MLEIHHSNDADEIRRLTVAGFEPIECSIGGESLVGPLEMDHHGSRSHLEGVAIRAYRDHAGARAEDPRFVVTGDADADATFAIAALAGLLPTPEEQELSGLANLIQRLDVDPLSVDLTAEPWAETVLLFRALTRGPEGSERFYLATRLWGQVLRRPPRHLMAAAREEEEERRRQAQAAPVLYDQNSVLAVCSPVWGFDVWYGRTPETSDPDQPRAWTHPLVLAFDPENKTITVGCPNRAVAESFFGRGGLLNALPKLTPAGWGGREAIGGSPRGAKLDQSQAIEAAKRLASLLRT
jgi:hypothetical protein